jgi:hypothetical protein
MTVPLMTVPLVTVVPVVPGVPGLAGLRVGRLLASMVIG